MAMANLRAAIAVAARHGLDPDAMRRAAGVSEEALREAPGVPPVERRVALEACFAVWESVIAHTGDPAVVLEAPFEVHPDSFDALGLAIGTAQTARAAWQRAARYMALWSDTSRFALDPDAPPGRARVVWTTPPANRVGMRACIEIAVASACRFARRVSPVPFVPDQVRFGHPAHGEVAAYQRHFGAPVAFGAPRTEVEFGAELLEVRLAPVDPAIDAYLVRRAEELAARLPNAGPLTTEVRRVVSSRLGADPSLAQVARALAIGDRTLRRRLADEGTSFAQVVDEVRREYATRELRAGRLGVGEIALALGFGDPGAFVRAFKRWTGKTPGAWRAAPASQASTL